jgi:23S rRNA pseudouridine2605 synthase
MTVGRLDLNSEGLLLLTNDGGIKRKLELPSTGWLRKYRVRVNGRPEDKTLEPLRKGIEVDGQKFQPMIVNLDRQQGANAWLTVGLREGKNREIRRAMADIGLTVNRLIRVSYGPFQLGQLKQGEVEEVRGKTMRDQLGLEAPPPPAPSKTRRGAKPGKPGKPTPMGKSRKFGTQGPSDAPTDKAKPKGRGKPNAADTSRRFTPPGKPGGKPGARPGGKPEGKPQVTRNRKPGRGPKSD